MLLGVGRLWKTNFLKKKLVCQDVCFGGWQWRCSCAKLKTHQGHVYSHKAPGSLIGDHAFYIQQKSQELEVSLGISLISNNFPHNAGIVWTTSHSWRSFAPGFPQFPRTAQRWMSSSCGTSWCNLCGWWCEGWNPRCLLVARKHRLDPCPAS